METGKKIYCGLPTQGAISLAALGSAILEVKILFAFLPWERLPAWLLGAILTAIGGLLLFDAELYSWRQAEAVGLLIVGVWMFLSGAKKLLAEPDIVSPVAPTRPTPRSIPDYLNFSEAQLRQVLTRIDRERFPDRVVELETRLAALESKGR